MAELYPQDAQSLYNQAIVVAQTLKAPLPGWRKSTQEREANIRRKLARGIGQGVGHLALIFADVQGWRHSLEQEMEDHEYYAKLFPLPELGDVAAERVRAMGIVATVADRTVWSHFGLQGRDTVQVQPGQDVEALLATLSPNVLE